MGQGVGSPAFRVEAMPTKGDRGLGQSSQGASVIFLMFYS